MSCASKMDTMHIAIDVNHMGIPNWGSDLPTWEDQIMPHNLPYQIEVMIFLHEKTK